ncbi:MAG: ribosomal protein L11 methyltransferase [Granulosicoccus sp.]
MNHLVFDISIAPMEPFRDILAAELFEIRFEATLESETGLQAFIIEDQFNRKDLDEVLSSDIFDAATIKITKEYVEEERNWNQEWEDRFEPVVVDGRCLVRAPFNEVQGDFEYELIIQPKMSFGTGHHATTSLMLKYLMDTEMPETVLDMGSGTGVLAIFCKKNGAKNVVAIDIDDWAYENTHENMVLNEVKGIEVRHGDASKLNDGEQFELILANINRNVLLSDMGIYSTHLMTGGTVLFSGFYTEDLHLIEAAANKNDMELADHHVQDNWVSARFRKN